MAPTNTRSFRRTSDGKNIELVTDSMPTSLKPTEVMVQIRAVSLNFRDVGMLNDRYPLAVIDRGIPCSDAAGTVLSIGSSVTGFKKGDHVCNTFRDVSTGEIMAMGGDVDGVLTEYAVFDQCNLTHVPEHLSFEEAATIPCAGVTAWTSLGFDGKGRRDVKSALMQGTGGVSIFALLLCEGAGIKSIITSSSDSKLDKVKKLGKDVEGINYNTTPDWDEEAKKLTQGKGVDVVINNIGITSMDKSFNTLKKFGTISLVGFLGGMPEGDMPDCFTPVLMKSAKVQGIFVGSGEDQQDLCDFLDEKKISLTPMIDRVFDFEDSSEAFKHLYSGAHTGKVVIKL